MKKRNIFITSALVLLAPTVLSLTSQNSQAATKLVGRTNTLTHLVDENGKALENLSLAANTDWQLGQIKNVDGNTYYEVATNEYALSTNMTVKETGSTTTPAVKTGTLSYAAKVVDPDGNPIGTVLPAGSSWKLGSTKTIDGNNYYEVGTNEYVIALAVKINSNTTTSTTNNTTSKIPMTGNGLIARTNVATKTYSYNNNTYVQTLPAGTSWKVSKLVVNKYGSYWGQVASDQYVWLGDVTINSGLNLKNNSEYIADFATRINK
ncbi:SLAP domain-containing protein [Companilactobacillus sp. HBUAS56257]|uniref:SLAP domain-containing protein n=1 Tax=Companilactobacillus sp. HBUAS56257 TaxID=3109360 RepID=UPI002FF3BF76